MRDRRRKTVRDPLIPASSPPPNAHTPIARASPPGIPQQLVILADQEAMLVAQPNQANVEPIPPAKPINLPKCAQLEILTTSQFQNAPHRTKKTEFRRVT